MSSKLVVMYDPKYVKIDSCYSLDVTLADYDRLMDAKVDEIFMNYVDKSYVRPSVEFLRSKRNIKIEAVPFSEFIQASGPTATLEDEYQPLIRLGLLGDLYDIDLRYIDLNYTVSGIDEAYDYKYYTVFKLSDVDKECASWSNHVVTSDNIDYKYADVMLRRNSTPNKLVMGAHHNHIVEFDRVFRNPDVFDY